MSMFVLNPAYCLSSHRGYRDLAAGVGLGQVSQPIVLLGQHARFNPQHAGAAPG